MSSASLSQRLQALSDSYRSTISLIQELQKFPNGGSQADDLDEQRLELANACHESLKDAEESLENLRQDVEDLDASAGRRRAQVRDEEHERNAAAVTRLAEDIRGARGAFRRAQLQSKKNLDARKQKDRELLFANRRSGANDPAAQVSGRQKGRDKLTQDDLNQNAAQDVTRALKRTHALMQSNIEQSQFAQQILEESDEQLKSLADQYLGTTEILQKSRGLVKTLVTSQKSDTWYLQTSVTILLVTIAWLVFRRLLYGPLWWFVYLPLSWTLRLAKLPFRGANSAVARSVTSNLGPSARVTVSSGIPNIQGYRAGLQENDEKPSPEMVEKIKQMINEAKEGTIVPEDDGSRNPKKRMMELEQEQQRIRDEL